MTRTLRAALLTLGDPHQLTGGYLFHRRLAELAAAHNARLAFVSVPERAFPLGILEAPRANATIERLRPDVVVIDSIAAAFMAFAKIELPTVGMLHQPPGGIDHGALRTLVQAALDRRAYARRQRLLVASESLADDLRRQGQPAARISVVPPGRDVAIDPVPPSRELRRGRRAAFLSVGNWMARKGTLDLLQAFAMLDDALGTLHLVGRTAAQPQYARRVWARLARPDLRARVVVHGALSISQVAGMYAAADVFVLPSLKEPYGTVYGEAMALGLPVVGWRAGNLPHLADHEREGLLVEHGDIRGLSEALRRLALDPALRLRLAAAARDRAMARPTWDQVASLFFGHLRDVVGSAV